MTFQPSQRQAPAGSDEVVRDAVEDRDLALRQGDDPVATVDRIARDVEQLRRQLVTIPPQVREPG